MFLEGEKEREIDVTSWQTVKAHIYNTVAKEQSLNAIVATPLVQFLRRTSSRCNE